MSKNGGIGLVLCQIRGRLFQELLIQFGQIWWTLQIDWWIFQTPPILGHLTNFQNQFHQIVLTNC